MFAFPSFLRGFADRLAVPQKWEFQACGGGDVMKNVSSVKAPKALIVRLVLS